MNICQIEEHINTIYDKMESYSNNVVIILYVDMYENKVLDKEVGHTTCFPSVLLDVVRDGVLKCYIGYTDGRWEPMVTYNIIRLWSKILSTKCVYQNKMSCNDI